MSESLVVPGEVIYSGEEGFLRGHGSYLDHYGGELRLLASVAGQIERVNKLVTVKPRKSRYIGEIGDLVVGRITQVESKRWKVDINGQREGILQLSSVNLPDGEQRMRTHEDQMQMRTLFEESDLISAEIQSIGADGQISLHTRSLKYGKLENGHMLTVPASLMKRLPQHYITFHFGVDVILGRNGMVWITRALPEDWKAQEEDMHGVSPLAKTLQRLNQRHIQTPLLVSDRQKVARMHNTIKLLASLNVQLDPSVISSVYERSIELALPPPSMFYAENIEKLSKII